MDCRPRALVPFFTGGTYFSDDLIATRPAAAVGLSHCDRSAGSVGHGPVRAAASLRVLPLRVLPKPSAYP